MNRTESDNQEGKKNKIDVVSNLAEERKQLWEILHTDRFRHYHFEKDKSIGHVIIDFYCEKWKVAIVVDPDENYSSEISFVDSESQEELEQLGIVFLRFRDSEIRKNSYIVSRTIDFWLKDRELSYL